MVEAGGGTKYIEIYGNAQARNDGTWGSFTVNYKGDLAVGPDGSWTFEGTIDFYDEWNFPTYKKHRPWYGQTLTYLGALLPGETVIVNSVSVPATQSSSDTFADWSGANAPDRPSRLATEMGPFFSDYGWVLDKTQQ